LTSPFPRYLAVIVTTLATIAGAALAWGFSGGDHFAALPLHGDRSWYRDFGGRTKPEIQDMDLFYHNVGESITNAREADVVVLGPSFVVYALDRGLLKAFETRHGIKIYDMAFIGIRGGEFSRRIIKRWNIRPKLWIINADDQFIHFFSSSLDLTLGPKMTSIPPATYGRLKGMLNIAGRNMRWRLEDEWAWLSAPASYSPDLGIYRRVDDGSVYLDLNPSYVAADNRTMPFERDPACHTNAETIKTAREYLADIGGRAILTLVPHSQYCPQQASELAQALGVEAIVPPNLGYTTVDGGGHLDHRGSVTFTEYFLTALEQSETFRNVLPSPSHAER
jgi:hypothetical protein